MMKKQARSRFPASKRFRGLCFATLKMTAGKFPRNLPSNQCIALARPLLLSYDIAGIGERVCGYPIAFGSCAPAALLRARRLNTSRLKGNSDLLDTTVR
ncbi:hypothetical protein SBC1_02950 [Caballeronia sp. SBC1]|nr:hypothetical protein SBC1_02950 [Caballeronia sp. SBC1]